MDHTEIERLWEPSLAGLGGKRARKPARYRAFVPGEIADYDWTLDSAIAEAIFEAERRCIELQAASGSVGLDTVARQLLRSEAVASSKIEGLVLSHRRLAKAAAVPSGDLTAQSVLANVAAIEAAYEFARSGEAFSVDALNASTHASSSRRRKNAGAASFAIVRTGSAGTQPPQ